MKKYFVYKVAVLLLCTALLTGCGQKDKAIPASARTPMTSSTPSRRKTATTPS